MPLGHRKLSAWYRQLAQQLEAGLPLADAIRASRGTGAPAAGLEQMATTIERGGSTDDALRAAGAWLPLADVLALSAAAGAGRMPRTLDNLSARHAEIGAAKLRLALACLYPLGILHFGLLLLPVMGMIDWEKGFQWSTTAYVRGVLRTIIPLWAVGGIFWIMARRGSPVLSRLARLLPGLRGYVRFQALADFCFGLANFLEAGVPIGQAWAAAGLVTRSTDLMAAAAAMETVIAGGAAPGRKLGAWACFPPEFVGLYRSGEDTGHLEANLHKLTAQYQDAANRALAFATLLYPAVLFVAVAGTVAYHVISIYAAYLRMLDKIV
ncbi:type II secretion system F family protein [Horticoccus sp. 23ND18S-11]|uniref:type II secretion system F family protein n=1 Tax=Horticoccus sp. 23ND18S-11 TaxID=3391832 RepID=UPI0039C92D52